MAMTVIISGIGLAIPNLGFARSALGMVAPPTEYYAYLGVCILAYMILQQLLKVLYIRIFKVWL
jgi:hypothetical protein